MQKGKSAKLDNAVCENGHTYKQMYDKQMEHTSENGRKFLDKYNLGLEIAFMVCPICNGFTLCGDKEDTHE